MRTITIDDKNDNQRLDKFLKKYFSAASSGFIYKMLRKKNITLNGKKDTGSSILNTGDKINVYFSDETFDKMRGLDESQSDFDYYKSLDVNLDIIYQDDNIIAVNKPAGILSQKSKDDDISINELIIAYLIKEKGYTLDEYRLFHPSVSNRLDYNTTGVILAAKTLKGQQSLSKALKERTLDKEYICVVKGAIKRDMTLTGSLVKDSDNNIVTITNERTNTNYDNELLRSDIITEITPVSSGADTSVLKIHLVTGKTHQIRAHLSHISHPIIGDAKYGEPAINDTYRDRYGVTSQLLHSYKTTYEGNEIIAPIPSVMSEIIEEEHGNLEL